MTAPGVPTRQLDQARWIARGLLRVVQDLDPDKASLVVAQLEVATDGRAVAWLLPQVDDVPADETVSIWEAAQKLGVKAGTVRAWTQRYPTIVPRVADGVRLADCRRLQVMSAEEKAAAA